jgi:signal transduction histidine kinase
MMRRRLPVQGDQRLLDLYVGVIAAGGIALVATAAAAGVRAVASAPLAFVLTALGAVLGERARIRAGWRGRSLCYTLSSPFLLVILALWGLPAALLVAVAASIGDDLLDRSSPRRLLLNLGQSSLALGIAGLVYLELAGGPLVSWRHALAFCAAALVKLTLSDLAVRVAVALHGRPSGPSHLLEHTTIYALTAALDAGLTLIVLLAVPDRRLIPAILGAPLLPVYLACLRASREREARAAAEASQLNAETAQTLAEKARAEAEAARGDAEHGLAEAERLAAEHAHMLAVADGLVRRLHTRGMHTRDTMALVALELREPLRPIAGIAASLLDQGHRLPAGARSELLAAALQHAEDASQTTQRLLLDAGRPGERAPFAATPAVIDAAAVVRQAGQLAAFIHRDRPIEVHAPRALPVRASADSLEHILDLLFSNADCHTPPGSPIRLEAVREGDAAVLAVQDRGPGIPADQRDRVFDRFTRLDGSGLGVGLYLARSLARRQSGELATVDPRGDGEGARFELTLPMAGAGTGT